MYQGGIKLFPQQTSTFKNRFHIHIIIMCHGFFECNHFKCVTSLLLAAFALSKSMPFEFNGTHTNYGRGCSYFSFDMSCVLVCQVAETWDPTGCYDRAEGDPTYVPIVAHVSASRPTYNLALYPKLSMNYN